MSKKKADLLFTRYHNQIALSLYHLLQAAQNGETITKITLQAALPHEPRLEELEETLLTLFFKKEGKTFKLRYPLSLPPLPLSLPELRWLKTMMEDDQASFLLSPSLREKLRQTLKAIPTLHTEVVQASLPTGDEPCQEPLHTCLVHFRQALQQRQTVALTWKKKEIVAQPFRLEVDAATRRIFYWLTQDGQDFQRLPAAEVSKIQLLTSKTQDLQPAFAAFLMRHARQMTLKITPCRNTVVRCFALFMSFKKEAIYDEATNTYRLRITYYDFDEEEVLRKVLSLGHHAVILDPEPLRQEIIRRLRETWAHYQEQHS